MTVGLLADREVTLRRIISRDNLTRAEGEARLQNQPQEKYYLTHCDLTVRNNGKTEELEKTAAAFSAKYLI